MSTLAIEQEVRDVITRIAHTIDARQWPQLLALFADVVTTDYTSLFGGTPQQQPREMLIDAWRTMLTPLDATQHLLGPVTVTSREGRTTAECHVRGYHRCESAPGGPEWMVAAHYLFELTPIAGAWRIRDMTLQMLYQSGNKNLLREAAESK